MRATILLLIIILPYIGIGQNKTSLEKTLWERVQSCYSLFEPNEDGILEYNKIDDSKNGYLKVWGRFPTCGCKCISTVGAYKDIDGNYTLLQKEEFLCEDKNSISSNKDLDKILPENFGIHTFSKKELNINSKYVVFFLDVEIPRFGTDTKVALRFIPFGIFQELNGSVISYDYSQEYENTSVHYIKEIEYMARTIIDDNTLTHLLKKDYESIHVVDRKFIETKIIGPDSWENFESFDELSEKLSILKNAYDIYSQLDFMSILMQWNKEKARFEVKSKSDGPKTMTFKEFILEHEFWIPIC
ncbi:hypothetical protein [Muricauda brasiliensis]|uniref:hypothetical protein n=1 Tax=Muricauda brasiliensis TaxID=2162892 RepID=UPI000D34063D|nr:hypothetical protein [Muricauda brasiliensis]